MKIHRKCLSILNSNHFQKLRHDLMKTVENKIKEVLRKIKSKLTKQESVKLYPVDSAPRKFYDIAKNIKC